MISSGSPIYKVGDWIFDTGSFLIRRDNETQYLRPQVRNVLLFLIEHKGQFMTATKIRQLALGVAHAENENTVHQVLTELRQALGQSEDRTYIETRPRVGYRLVADIEKLG